MNEDKFKRMTRPEFARNTAVINHDTGLQKMSELFGS